MNAVLQEGAPRLVEGQILVPGWVEDETLTVNGAAGAVELEVFRTGTTSFPPVIALADAAGLGGADDAVADTAAAGAVPMLLVVTGLLAVSVLIALIGVANTLSLSTIERTRENSLMRALGLTRRGLRTMLATEAVLIAGIAALLGSALGVFYGWMGAESLLGNLVAEGSAAGRLVPTVPWLELAAVVAVAVVAGLLASVGPSRRAARLSPVEGLAVL